ncbi:MAG: glycosyltransferase, partial [Gemmatimonadales bacterium]
MIYVCIPSYNEAPTIGLLLWKIRQVFAGFQREYQLLVLDDGSSDATAEVLERYTRVLPLSVTRHQERQGYADSVEELLRLAV